MTIDNSQVAVNDRKFLYITIISSTLLIPTIMLSEFFETPVLGIQKEFYVLALAVVYLIAHIFKYILNLTYINFTIENGKISLKYFSFRPFQRKRKNIEFPSSALAKFELKESFFGLKKSIVLYQRMKGKLAKYPPISLSALKKEEQEKLQNALSSLVSKN